MVSNVSERLWDRRERSRNGNCLEHRPTSGGCFPTSPVEDHRRRRQGGTATVPPLTTVTTVSGFARPVLSPLQIIQQHPALPCCRFHRIVKTVRNQLGPENPDTVWGPGMDHQTHIPRDCWNTCHRDGFYIGTPAPAGITVISIYYKNIKQLSPQTPRF